MDRKTPNLGAFDKWGRFAPWVRGATGLQFWSLRLARRPHSFPPAVRPLETVTLFPGGAETEEASPLSDGVFTLVRYA